MKKRTVTVTISQPDLSFALSACSPSLLDGVGNALFKRLWRELRKAQGKCQWNRRSRTKVAKGEHSS